MGGTFPCKAIKLKRPVRTEESENPRHETTSKRAKRDRLGPTASMIRPSAHITGSIKAPEHPESRVVKFLEAEWQLRGPLAKDLELPLQVAIGIAREDHTGPDRAWETAQRDTETRRDPLHDQLHGVLWTGMVLCAGPAIA